MGSLSLEGVISRYKWHSPSEKMLYLYHLAAFMKDIHTNMEERETDRENVTLLATHRACWSACSEIPGSSTYPDLWTKECIQLLSCLEIQKVFVISTYNE